MIDDYVAALEEAESFALDNNYLGTDFDLHGEEDCPEAAKIADRARGNKDLLAFGIDFRNLELKENNDSRPLWVVPTGDVYLEVNNQYFEMATELLVAISEPESRPEYIHHYRLTPYSLYAAVSSNLDTETILRTLDRFSKVGMPPQVSEFIRKCTESHGKAKLVLKRNRLFVESKYASVLRKLLKIPAIRSSREESTSMQWERQVKQVTRELEVEDTDFIESEAPVEDPKAQVIQFADMQDLDFIEQRVASVDDERDDEDDTEDFGDKSRQSGKDPHATAQTDSRKRKSSQKSSNEEEKNRNDQKMVSFEIRPDCIEQVKEAAMSHDFPLMEEYDFRGDHRNPDLPFNLKASTKIRSYQEKSLAKMFSNGRARSGVIVLPCGAGKTLTGITAACTIKKSCIIFCINAVGVEQWIRSIKSFTNIDSDYVRRFTSRTKDDLHPSGATILVTTYNMMSYSKARSEDGVRVMKQVQCTDWGLIIMDEVHVVPAKMFRMALRYVKSHCKLGLTATLVREDNLIDDLNFLIGPKLYEANWLNLTSEGYLAKVLCAEVWCPMTAEFLEEYLSPNRSIKEKQLLYVMNPNKFAICRMLMDYHRKKKDKILIFSDNIPAIKRYSSYLGIYNMYGDTSHNEREEVLRRFRGGKGVRSEEEIDVLLISQVGDVGIDLPQANVIIQISSHFGSRRQEAQRLGRILRPKQGESFSSGDNAFFYTLISMDTAEMYFSHKRQKYLVDQGYTFKVIRNIKTTALESGISYQELGAEDQRSILRDLYAEEVAENLKIMQERQMNVATSRNKKKLPPGASKLYKMLHASRNGF